MTVDDGRTRATGFDEDHSFDMAVCVSVSCLNLVFCLRFSQEGARVPCYGSRCKV